MPLLLAALTFLIIIVVAGGIVFFVTSNPPPEKMVAKRLEAIERSSRRGSDSIELQLVRDELLSEIPSINRFLLKWRWSTRLQNYIGQSGLKIKPGKLLLISLIAAVGAYLLVVQLTGIFVVGILAGIAGAVAPISFVSFMRSRRLYAFEKTFPEAIDLLGRAVRAGHSFSTGLEMITTELPDPVAGEFRTVFEEQNFGLPLRDALLNLVERVPIIDVRFFVTAVLIQKETGGNLAEILDNLGHVVRERFRILGEVRIRTAQGRMTAGILISLPPIMVMVLKTMNPNYMKPLFNDPFGPIVLAIAATMQILGSLMLWKIVNIEV
jgi:tight adherence protein B